MLEDNCTMSDLTSRQKRDAFSIASTVLSIAGMGIIAFLFVFWLRRDGAVNRAGYVLATISVVLFAVICLRFIPEWMNFWRRGEAPNTNVNGIGISLAMRLFLSVVVADIIVLLLVCLLRHMIGQAPTLWDGILFWNWLDTGCYLTIADSWYVPPGFPGELCIVFFPGYPIAIMLFKVLLRNTMVSALLVSSLCHSLSAIALYKLLLLDYPKEIARRIIKYLIILPAAFFFSAPMSESLFFLLSVSCFYYARKGKWLVASVLGCLCAFTRSVGVLVFAAVFIEWFSVFRFIRNNGERSVAHIGGLFSLALIPMGLAAYLLINKSVTGNAFTFMEFQSGHWGQCFGLFF